MGLGQFRGPGLVDRHTSHCPNQISIIAQGKLDVCDGGYGPLVMKKIGGRRRKWDTRPRAFRPSAILRLFARK
jgi:hypothetical protein